MLDTLIEHEATEVGRSHGFNHANYVDAYGGDMDEAPDVPARFASVSSYYEAAYAEGVQEYRDQASDCE